MTTFDKVKEIVKDQFYLDDEDITMDLNFFKDLGADSLDAVELAMMAEYEFNIEIEDSEIVKIKTVRDLVNLVDRISEDR